MDFKVSSIFILLTIVLHVAQSDEYIRTKRRMYAMCPPKFQRIGSECYSIGTERVSWMEAHFECKDKNSKLAEPIKLADRKIRTYLQSNDMDLDDIWIGATYDWNRHIWIWGSSNKNLTYNSFRRIEPGSSENLAYNCAVFDPRIKYRWSPRPCVDKHRYMCEHKMPKVSATNRIKVYDRWNQTYPHQYANEVILEIVDNVENGPRSHRRVKAIGANDEFNIPYRRTSPRIAKRRPVPTLRTTSVPNYITNEINSEYLPIFPMRTKDTNGQLQPEEPKKMASPILSTIAPQFAEKHPNHRIKVNRQPNKRTEFDRAVEKKRRLERQMRRKQRKEQREKNQKLKQEQLAKKLKLEQEQLAERENEKRLNEVQEEKNKELERAQEEKHHEAAIEEKKRKHDEMREQIRREEMQREREAERLRQQQKEAERIKQEEAERARREQEEADRIKKEQLLRENAETTAPEPVKPASEKTEKTALSKKDIIKQRLALLSPEDQKKFLEMIRRKKHQKRRTDEATIPH